MLLLHYHVSSPLHVHYLTLAFVGRLSLHMLLGSISIVVVIKMLGKGRRHAHKFDIRLSLVSSHSVKQSQLVLREAIVHFQSAYEKWIDSLLVNREKWTNFIHSPSGHDVPQNCLFLCLNHVHFLQGMNISWAIHEQLMNTSLTLRKYFMNASWTLSHENFKNQKIHF